jgi:alanine dehydrogenase
VVGDFVDNYKHSLPSEFAVLNLFDPATGMPRAIIAVGAEHLARKSKRILGHVGARGTSYWNARLLNHLFDFDEKRVHSSRPESREAFAAHLEKDLGNKIVVTDNWRDCLEGADTLWSRPRGSPRRSRNS